MVLRGKAILFDIDGTLVDSTPAVERSWHTWAREYDVDYEALMRVSHGRRTEDTVAEFVAPQRRADAVARLQELELTDLDDVTALPGARGLLGPLSRDRWAAVTSGERPLMTARLTAALLPVPDIMICAEDVVAGKPSPEGYLKAAAALGHDATQCVVVEDSPAGIAAGKAAGSQVLAVTTTHDADQVADADMIVADLSRLLATFGADGVVLAALDQPDP